MKTINVNFEQSRLSRDEMRSIDGGTALTQEGEKCPGDCNWDSQCGDDCRCVPYESTEKAGYCKAS